MKPFRITPPPKMPKKAERIMGGPKIKTYCPSLTRAQMYTPGIGLRLGMEKMSSVPPAPPVSATVFTTPDGLTVFTTPDESTVFSLT